jgi:hypothetical protein
MKYFLFSILALALSGCSSYYKNLQPVNDTSDCAGKIKPQGIATAWFDTSIDVVGKHISGLMLIKEMPDQSSRIVFTNESGFSIFDFEFQSDGKFTVKKIIPQLDRKAVTETLRKDFSLLLGIPFRQTLQQWQMNDESYFGIIENGEKIYFSTTPACDSVGRLETGSRRARKTSITFEGPDARNPRSITIKHFTFEMIIALKRIDKNVTE